MSKREEIEKKTEELLLPILKKQGLTLWDVEYVKEASEWYLRAYIDKPSGVTIDDCVDVSRALSDRLDEQDFVNEAYTLEVSSPGLGRLLKRDRDFEHSIGRKVDLKLYQSEDGNKELAGVLMSYDRESVTVKIKETERSFPRKALASIRLSFEE
ncbi:MAG: ribosome maturation factor RimP [Lachnospiraceae bacterium]|nr:ribosome maturation factor RimP [Lachnospiraceae bacterium]